MLDFMLDKKVIVKRYSSDLGEYNRPKKTLKEVGSYPCHISESNSNTAQKAPQKEATQILICILSLMLILSWEMCFIFMSLMSMMRLF